MFNFLNTKKENNNSENIHVTQLYGNYDKNIALFKEIFQADDTIIFHELLTTISYNIRICIIYTIGMADQREINKNLIGSILNSNKTSFSGKNLVGILKKQIIRFGNSKEISDVDKIVGAILYGDTFILIEDYATGLVIESKGFESRKISEPLSENVVRGPRDSFTETLLINTSLIRRRINNSALKFSFDVLGTKTRTKICICYIDGLANIKILQELTNRLNKIHLDSILDSGYVEEMIKDSPLSPFSTVGHSERPDKIVANLLLGRIAIMIDGTPIVITVPFLFNEYFQSSEDYYNDFLTGSTNRLLRWSAFFLSTSIPALYIALTDFHKEMIPTPLLINISAARSTIPFPTIIEAFIMLFIFEILREGGSRLPSSIGSTISFVGAVVIGDAAVNAKFVSAPIVIVIALTGLSNFLIPKLMGPLIFIRTFMLLLAGILGLYGYLFGLMGLFIHLLSMYSFGIPYMLNISTLDKLDIKDTFIRVPWWYHPKK